MEGILDKELNEEDIVSSILSSSVPLQANIKELEKAQSSLTARIQALASNYHLNIIEHQSNLQNLGNQIKTLQKKCENLNQKTVKIGKDLDSGLEKMTDGIQKLEKVQKASEMVKLLQVFFMKTKKGRVYDQKEIEEIALQLKGVHIISKSLNKS